MLAVATELRKFVAPELIFGHGARLVAARYARNFGASKVLVVTDPGIMVAGWANEALHGLEAEKMPYHLFAGVTANPKAAEVMAGAEEYERAGCDLILVVGGGSPIDCAKGIGIVSSNGGNILEFIGVDQVPVPGPPLVCIPTTGSGADVSQFAVITDTGRRLKTIIISKALVPDVTLVDPRTLSTMPYDLAAHAGMDALTHGLEAYVSNANSPITDLFALEGIRLLASSLPLVCEHSEDPQVFSRAMLGSLYAGLAFSNASLGLVHAMAHSLGGYLDIPHGKSNSSLVNHVVAFNYDEAEEKYAAIGEALGLPMSTLAASERKSALLAVLTRLKQSLAVDVRLRELGISRDDIAELADKAIEDPCVVTNPRRPTRTDIERLYEQAL